MSLEKALALAELGLHVFPVREKNGPQGKIKTPIPLNGFEGGTTNRRVIEARWNKHPDAWVGVWCGPSGIIAGDIDEHDGQTDGRDTLRDEGVDELDTFSYGTLSGHGRHWIYEGPNVPNGKPFGPSKGVDRQSGDSYIIWYGPVPSSRKVFKPAPGWLMQNVSESREHEKIDSVKFIAELTDEPMNRYMQAAHDRIPETDFGRHDLYRRAVEIASLHFEGQTGAKHAFRKLASEWLRPPFDGDDYYKDLLNSVGNAIGYAKLNASPFEDPATTEEDSPPEPGEPPSDDIADRILSWGELMQTSYDVDWLIEGLLATNGLALVTGRSGVGKTTLAMQLAATFATGADTFLCWEIPAARKRKVLFLSLELEGWGLQQFMRPLGQRFDQKDLAANLMAFPYGEPMMLTTPEGRKQFLGLLDEAQPDILVIDSLGETSRDLTDEKEAAELFDLYKWVKKNAGIATFIVHHHRKVSSENAGQTRRLNDLSDVYGNVAVTKQADAILDVDDARSNYHDPKATVVKGKVAINLLKIRYGKLWQHPKDLHRADDGHFSIDDTLIPQEERDEAMGLDDTGHNLFGVGA